MIKIHDDAFEYDIRVAVEVRFLEIHTSSRKIGFFVEEDGVGGVFPLL